MSEFCGSMVILVTKRSGRFGVLRSFRVQSTEVVAPFTVLYTSPLLCPTQMILELPGATAMALMKLPTESLTADQEGIGAFTLVDRHRLAPPASNVLELLGSRTKGAMKLA